MKNGTGSSLLRPSEHAPPVDGIPDLFRRKAHRAHAESAQDTPLNRARQAMLATGQWDSAQFIGRRLPVGCVALEITQRCNLDCSACYFAPARSPLRGTLPVSVRRRRASAAIRAVLRDDQRPRFRQIEHLAGNVAGRHRRAQRFAACGAGLWIMLDRSIGCFNPAKCPARMALLATAFLARRSAKTADPDWLFQPVAGRWLAAIAAIQPKPTLQFRQSCRQRRIFRTKHCVLGLQRPYRRVAARRGGCSYNSAADPRYQICGSVMRVTPALPMTIQSGSSICRPHRANVARFS
jgi:hypothetical protein